MGINYYLIEDYCPRCGQGGGRLHIGKASVGWCFALRIHPDKEIYDLENWIIRLSNAGGPILDEYNKPVSLGTLVDIITNRSAIRDFDWSGHDLECKSEDDFHEKNDSERGPNGLFRRRIGSFCVRHGRGTWDCIEADFS